MYTQEKLIDQSWNIMNSTLASLVLILDQSLNDVYGSKDPDDTSKLGASRAIIYMMRNMFSHSTYKPVWKIKGKYQRKYVVDLSDLSIFFNGKELDGNQFKPDDIGGYEGFITLVKNLQCSLRGK